MTKYTAKDMVATFGSTTFLCLNSVEVAMSADIYTVSCAGATYKSKVVGNTDASITINYTFDDSAITELSNILPGTTGTFTCSTNTTVGPQFNAATIVESHNVTAPVEGLVAGVITLGVDGALTIS